MIKIFHSKHLMLKSDKLRGSYYEYLLYFDGDIVRQSVFRFYFQRFRCNPYNAYRFSGRLFNRCCL